MKKLASSDTVRTTRRITVKKKPNTPMMKTSILENFTRQYSLSKTLRFELRPVGETKDSFGERPAKARTKHLPSAAVEIYANFILNEKPVIYKRAIGCNVNNFST